MNNDQIDKDRFLAEYVLKLHLKDFRKRVGLGEWRGDKELWQLLRKVEEVIPQEFHTWKEEDE